VGDPIASSRGPVKPSKGSREVRRPGPGKKSNGKSEIRSRSTAKKKRCAPGPWGVLKKKRFGNGCRKRIRVQKSQSSFSQLQGFLSPEGEKPAEKKTVGQATCSNLGGSAPQPEKTRPKKNFIKGKIINEKGVFPKIWERCGG